MKKIIAALISVTLLLSLVGCSKTNSSSTNSETSNTPVKLTVAHVLADSHPENQALTAMAKEAETKGFEINIIPGGALGTESDEINQVATGALDMALIQGISLFQGIDKKLAVEEVPFLFASREQAYKAVDGAYGNKVSEILEKNNIHVIAYWENGFRHFTNSKRPIVKPEDLKGIKFRSAPSEIRLKMFSELGASAVPMAFNELFTALQQGTVGGQENPLSIISSSKFYEVQKYLSLSGHIWNSSVLIISPNVWQKLSDDQKQALQDLSFKYREQARTLIAKQDEEILNDLKANGMQINDVDKKAFQEAVKNVTDVYVKENGDELLKLAQQAK